MTGPLRFADGAASGPRGPQGDPGAVDTSSFYSKGDSDARLLAVGGTAADADKLDGLNSSDLARGGSYDYGPEG